VIAMAAALLAISLRNAQLFQETREASLRDGLTGCFNRTHGIDVIDTELRRARRSQMPVSIIMFDIDHFKDVNDHYGHLCGDAVLASVGARMREVLRGSDLKCRYGGEEFLVLLPGAGLDDVIQASERIRRAVSETTVEDGLSRIAVTVSVGAATYRDATDSPEALVALADRAMYTSKDGGRDRVTVA